MRSQYTSPEMDWNSKDDAFLNIVLPLMEKYEETFWFADDRVAITQEKANTQSTPGWTDDLVKIGKIKNDHLKGKYIELERMLSSVVCLHLFYDGTKTAYDKFISVQTKNDCLTWASFQSIHELARRVIKTPALFEAMEAMLIYSDIGKTPKAREKAKELNITHQDHDDWIEAVLSQENNANISKIIPSFFKLATDNKLLLRKIAMAMKIHLGHVAHLEGGEKMFHKFHSAVSKGMVDPSILEFAFLIQLCDVASSAAHENNKGSLALVEGWYQVYVIVNQALQVITKGGNSNEALHFYITKRGEQLNLNASDAQEQLLLRLSCMLRFYNAQNSGLLKEIAKELSESSWSVLKTQFDLFGGINSWERNPTYVPAVFLNLARLHADNNEPNRDKLFRALNGFVCLAKLLEDQAPQNKNNQTPISFNELAKLASEKPDYFLISQFDQSKFRVNDNNHYVYGELQNVSLKKHY